MGCFFGVQIDRGTLIRVASTTKGGREEDEKDVEEWAGSKRKRSGRAPSSFKVKGTLLGREEIVVSVLDSERNGLGQEQTQAGHGDKDRHRQAPGTVDCMLWDRQEKKVAWDRHR